MEGELETELRCSQCGGQFGAASIDGGGVSASCLSCGHVLQGPICPSTDPQPLWRVCIRWSGRGPTPKEAALLRQFLPNHANDSIQKVRERYRNATEWTERMLSKGTMLQLRAAAEARGFQVEVEQEGENTPQLRPPSPPATSYGVQFSPSFHEKGFIAATFGKSGDTVTVASERSPTTPETVAIPIERGLRFLDEIAALDPLGIPDGESLGIDGIRLECLIHQENGTRKFSAWSPDPARHPRQHGFVHALYRLAVDLSREPAPLEFLEHLHGYLHEGLPVKVFEGTPCRVRLFGMLSSQDADALDALFASFPPDEPLLMDLSGFEGMGTLLHPHFLRFHARAGRTAWWVTGPASQHLRAAGVPGACLHADLEAALAALKDR